jgi:hypothetical protein
MWIFVLALSLGPSTPDTEAPVDASMTDVNQVNAAEQPPPGHGSGPGGWCGRGPSPGWKQGPYGVPPPGYYYPNAPRPQPYPHGYPHPC